MTQLVQELINKIKVEGVQAAEHYAQEIKNKASQDSKKIIEKAKLKLHPRKEHVMKQLKRTGVEAKQLTTPELIGLFHRIYNPTEYVPLSIKREIEQNQVT